MKFHEKLLDALRAFEEEYTNSNDVLSGDREDKVAFIFFKGKRELAEKYAALISDEINKKEAE